MMLISLAAAASAFSPSEHRMTSAAKSGLSTARMCALSAFFSMKSAVFPVRSRKINTAVCSSDKPRLLALTPRLRVPDSSLVFYPFATQESRFHRLRQRLPG